MKKKRGRGKRYKSSTEGIEQKYTAGNIRKKDGTKTFKGWAVGEGKL